RAGKVVEKKYNYITKVVATYAGKTVASFDTTQSVSENPFFAFPLKVTAPGTVTVTFTDTAGGTYEGTADIKLS
ncbi:MAG: thiosulfate oxidation carrier complex protein SoxZ, partial [Candidatus Rokuibacteriota bacterium]